MKKTPTNINMRGIQAGFDMGIQGMIQGIQAGYSGYSGGIQGVLRVFEWTPYMYTKDTTSTKDTQSKCPSRHPIH